MAEATSEDPFVASRISVAVCTHGTIWLRLHDEAGEVCALAPCAPDVSRNLTRLLDELEHDAKNGGIPACVGRA